MHTQMGGMMGGQGMMGVDPETMADLQSQMADFHQQMIDLHLEFMGAANPVDSTDDAGEAASSGDAELPAVTDS